MKAKYLEKHQGSVIVFDLANGKEITGRVSSVDVEESEITVSKPRMFVPIPHPQQGDKVSVAVLNYGHPLYAPEGDELTLETSHVVSIFIPPQPYVDEYVKQTSGIVPAQSSALSALDDIKAKLQQ